MEIYQRNVEALGKRLEKGLEQPVLEIPEYRTVEPRRLYTTKHVGALDGSDQQMFSTRCNPELGVGIWATLYLEFSVYEPDQELYRDGPSSAGFWSEDEILAYHITVSLPDDKTTREFRNDYHVTRQILSSTRFKDPPIFSTEESSKSGAREESARQRATGEWLATQSALIQQLEDGDLFLRDGRFNCQMEQSASWVDQMGRIASRNGIRAVAVAKSGFLWEKAYPIVRAIAQLTDRPFYFLASKELIKQSYKNDKYPIRKTLMLGGRDDLDLGGIGALWTVFCPNPQKFTTFVILEFNVYDLFYYKGLNRIPQTLFDWHINELQGDSQPTGKKHIWVSDLKIHPEHDVGQLVEPTLAEILWLCEQEVGRFGYPNLLGLAHHDVVLTKKKVDLLRKRYLQILSDSDLILAELVANEFIDTPHKLHNIY